ncbi:YaeQ family protein [Amphibiibacter pelophylacis]|uniref:YaeQ family protein n=1 Tax=Amphibiibacter pelophylacis TaxID=1799477 RepID=A0ACC6NYY4_9BURK
MALKSTIFKAQVAVADIDHSYYSDHALTLARHPSETDERMMVRLLALALNAWQLADVCQGDGVLRFGAGLSDPSDPDVVLTDFTGRHRLWIEVGQPEERALQRACNQADAVAVYAFASSARIWWPALQNKVARMDRLQVWGLPPEAAPELAALAQRSMVLQATVQDGAVTLSSEAGSISVEPVRWK